MKRFIFRGEELLGTHSLPEAAAMLAKGTLLPDDWVSEGLGYISLASWLERFGDDFETTSFNLQRPEVIGVPDNVPMPGRKVIRFSHKTLSAETSDHRVFTRRRVLFGVTACLAAATGVVTIKSLTHDKSSIGGGRLSLDELRRSIVRIIVKNEPAGMGTGFCIDLASDHRDGSVIASAAHVVDANRLDSLIDSEQAAVIQTDDGQEWAIRAPYSWDKRLDHCAFHTQRALVPLKLAEKLPPVGARIYALGFAEGETFAVVEGEVLGYSTKNLRMLTSAKVVGGFSGGPVVNEDGEVIGMTVTRARGGQPSSGSVPLHELQNLRQRMEFINMAGE